MKSLQAITRFPLLLLVLAASPTQAAEAAPDCPQSLRYTFSWSLEGSCGFGPRGGSSKGAPLTLDAAPHPGWLALQEPGLSPKEKDRRAILAMAGPYRTSFEFIETVGYTRDFERARPYQSWGTEYVYVVEDSENFISLQHIMVMFAQADDGSLMGPFVQKHWRQDWHYEKTQLLVHVGPDTWQVRSLQPAEVSGAWSQSVYQVDDSPRYEASGRWEHHANFSTWRSDTTWRPLPRRESSVRDDYQVLEGTNRHTIIHNGWVHEEENYKLRLDAGGQPVADAPYLAKELGVNRYERIKDFDFSAGDAYWERTAPFWSEVRAVWREYFSAAPQLHIVEEANGVPLFAALFEQAEALTEERFNDAQARAIVRDILDDYID
ncbi:MAG: DUF6607 family protein [Pseudohongiellaceae bacterium]